MSKKHDWTDDENKIMLSDYHILGPAQTAAKLGLTVDVVDYQASKMGLRAPARTGHRIYKRKEMPASIRASLGFYDVPDCEIAIMEGR